MPEPRIIIREIEGDCSVQVFSPDNALLLSERVEEDPYLFISRLREALEKGIISEEPTLNINGHTPHSNSLQADVARLTEEICALTSTIGDLLKHIDQQDLNPKNFTDGLY